MFRWISVTCVVLLFATSGCKKLWMYGNHEVDDHGTRILAHRGGPTWPYGSFQGNTLEACIYGFTHADGVEVDVQMSRSGTLWLYHDEFFSPCDVNDLGRLPAYTDDELQEHIACMGGTYTLTKLEDLFIYCRDNHIDKYIELEIKSWLPTKYSNTPSYLLDIADKIVYLARYYGLESQVGVECESAMFLNRIKNQSSIQTFLTTHCDLYSGCRKALRANYTGISHRGDCEELTAKDIDIIHRKGLLIHIWTIDDESLVNKAIVDQVDFIQTNNL